MANEFELRPEEFEIGKCYLMDDVKSIPFVAIQVITPLTASEIAHKAFGKPSALKDTA